MAKDELGLLRFREELVAIKMSKAESRPPDLYQLFGMRRALHGLTAAWDFF